MINGNGNSMYNEKTNGHNIDPCGTPEVEKAGEEKTLPTITEKL